MKLRRGCGCPIIILMVVDAIFVVGAILGLVRGPSETTVTGTTWGSGLMLAIMLANTTICGIVALGALRSQPVGSAAGDAADEGLDYGEETAPPDPDTDEHRNDE